MSITFYILVFLAVVFLLSTFFTVRQQTAVSIERFGKFESIRHSGCVCKDKSIGAVCGYQRKSIRCYL